MAVMKTNAKPIPAQWLELIRRGDREAVIWALVLEGRGGIHARRRDRDSRRSIGRKLR